MLRVQDPFVMASFADGNGPDPLVILLGFCDSGFGPNRELHRRGIPLHEKSQLLSWRVGWPVFGIREVWEMIGPMGEMKRKVLVSISPDRPDLLGSLDDQSGYT